MRPSTAPTQTRPNRQVPVADPPDAGRLLAGLVHANWLAGRPDAENRTARRPR